MVSMKDIAKLCGVSVATVSKSLNGYSDIGEETRKRVLEAAEAAGYLPNSSARALKTNRSYNLGVLFLDEAQSGLKHDFFAAVLDSFKRQAEAGGYDITFANSRISNRKTSYYEYCRYRGVDGVLIACIDYGNPDVQSLIQSDLPLVTIDHLFDNRTAVCSDNVRGMEELTEYICGMGHRKVAYIHGEDCSVTRNRMGSFYRTMAAHGAEVPDEYVRPGEYRDSSRAREATLELLSLPDPPTCILFPDDFAAIGGINAIKERGLRIPEDISIAGYDGIPLSQVLEPRMTTICQDTDQIGRVAADRLISLIEQPKLTLIEHILIPGRLERGESVGCLRS